MIILNLLMLVYLLEMWVLFTLGRLWINAAMNIHLPAFVWVYVFISLGHLPSFMELLGHKVTLWLTFGGTTKLFFKMVALFYIPTCSVWRSQFIIIINKLILVYLPFIIICLLDSSSIVGVKWYLTVAFLIHIFLIANDVEHLFMFFRSYVYICPLSI